MARGRKNISETEIGNTGINLKGVSGKVDEDLSKLWKGKEKRFYIRNEIQRCLCERLD